MRERWPVIVVVVTALVLSLAYAASYGTTNQATYLLDPIHRAMPELYRRDWFVSGTPPYLPVFGWLAQWLYVLDPAGPVAIVLAHVVVMIATYAAIYALVVCVGGDWRAFAVVASFATVTKGVSMGGSYLLVGYLQPSSLSTLGWIVAMAALACDRYLACGIAAALAGVMHANYLVLGVGLFALAAFARRDLNVRDYAKVLVPQLVVLAAFAPTLFHAAHPSDQAVWILTHFHAPVHYAPHRLVWWIPSVLSWQLGGYAALRVLDGDRRARVLWRFSVVAFAVVAGSALVIRFTPLTWLTQVRWSRIAPFGELACQVLMAAALVRLAVTPPELSPRARVLIGLGFLAPLAETGAHLASLVSWPALGVGAVLVVLALVPRPRVAQAALAGLAAVTLAYTLWTSPRGEGLHFEPIASSDELALARWAQTATPVDALFLAPPGEYRFRLLARRAVVVDTKSPPLQPDLLVEWYRRLCASVLVPDAPTFEAVEARYHELSAAELAEVARSFGADFIVVTARPQFPDPPVFENATYRVYRAR